MLALESGRQKPNSRLLWCRPTKNVASMLSPILVHLAGTLTIANPCILPVLPFVFGRADRPF
jgi:cytochrome c biogenesis protein CcdA